MSAADEFGTLERHDDVSVLHYERRLRHPLERVWRAITEDADLAAWFPTTIEGPRRHGAPLRFSFRQGEAEAFAGEMLAFVPPTLMELRWADDVLRFELEPDEDGDGDDHGDGMGCILRLSVTFTEFGKAARDAAGWHVCLERLYAWCDGAAPPGPDRWKELFGAYVERFGPEASAIGPPEDLAAHGPAAGG
jgi:uncharacterized protein YndB with AHSA1/START domain